VVINQTPTLMDNVMSHKLRIILEFADTFGIDAVVNSDDFNTLSVREQMIVMDHNA
jgi:hypothetical protein